MKQLEFQNDKIKDLLLYMLYGANIFINIMEDCYLDFRQYEEMHLHHVRASQTY
jgi:hypothetical protein